MKKMLLFLGLILSFALLNAQNSASFLSASKAAASPVNVEMLKNVTPAEREIAQKNAEANLISSEIPAVTPLLIKNRAEILNESFPNGTLPAGWLNIDADGDSWKWQFELYGNLPPFPPMPTEGRTDAYCINSASYYNGVGPLSPDNWLITPQLQLGSGGSQLTWWERTFDAGYPDSYGVFISTTGTSPSDFTPIWNGTATTTTWVQRTVNITQSGNCYIAFRHYNMSDMYVIGIDDIIVTTEGDTPPPDCDPARNLAVELDEDCTMATLTWDAPAKSNRGNIARGRVAYGGPKYIEFDCENIMGNTTINTTLECYGGGYYDGTLYCYKTDADGSGNPTTCTYQIVNSASGVITSSIVKTALHGVIVSSLCYDYSTNKMYAVRGNPNILFTVNLETGDLTQVASITGLGAGLPLTFAIDLDGNAFVIESSGGPTGNAQLYSINLSTGACTAIGSGTGLSMNYAQSMAFDYNDPAYPLYWAQIDQPIPGNIVTTWTKVNTTTGVATSLQSNIGMEICALHFPYGNGTPSETKYNVYRDDVKIAGPIDATTYEDKTIAADVEYTWAVKVICDDGGESDPVTVKDKCEGETPDPCNPVTGADVTFDECAKATVTWTAVAGATGYEVTRDGKTETVTGTTFTDEFAFESGKDYTWDIVTVCADGKSTKVSVTKACSVGINDPNTTFSIVPNPATNHIEIKAKTDFSKVEIVNFLGQTVLIQANETNKSVVDVSNLTNGVYFVRIISEHGTSVQKFVKQ